MKKSKVAIFSDLHLGIYGNSEDWHKIALEWADWVVKDLKKKKIKDILFLGDFFHNRSEISVQTIDVASKIIDKFAGFEMIMVVGNHDAYYKNRCDTHSLALLRGHKNLTIVDENLELEEFGKTMLFVPWNSDIPNKKYDYIFGHFEIINFKMNNYKVCDHGLSATDILSKNSKNIFSGHFHTRYSKSYKNGDIHYVGNTFPQDFNDVGNTKGYYTLDLEDNELEFFENTVSPKYIKIKASKLKTYKEEDLKNNIVKLLIDVDATDEQVEKIQRYVSKFKPHHHHTEYNVVSKSIDDVDEIDSLEIIDAFDEYIKELSMEEEKEERVDKIIKDLYEKHA